MKMDELMNKKIDRFDDAYNYFKTKLKLGFQLFLNDPSASRVKERLQRFKVCVQVITEK